MPKYEAYELIRGLQEQLLAGSRVDAAIAKDGIIDIRVEERIKPIGLNWTVDISTDWKLAFRSNQRATCTLVSKMQPGQCNDCV